MRVEHNDLRDLRGAIERSLTASLKRLRTDRVALFQLHNQLGEAVGGREGLPPEDVLGRGGVADIFDLDPLEPVVTGQILDGQHPLHACLPVR